MRAPSTRGWGRREPDPLSHPESTEEKIIPREDSAVTPSWIDSLRSARVYDLEQPRFFGMPVYPTHRPGYFYALHRRHRDGFDPANHGPRTGSSGVLTMIEHTGTHIDALCHQACGLKLF